MTKIGDSYSLDFIVYMRISVWNDRGRQEDANWNAVFVLKMTGKKEDAMITWLYLNGVRGTGEEGGGGRSDHVGKSLLKQQGSAQSGPSANWDIGGTSGGHKRRFSRNRLSFFHGKGHCVQFWPGCKNVHSLSLYFIYSQDKNPQ